MTSSTQQIEVDFEHWQVVLSEDSLQYGSPHYGEARAHKGLFQVCKDIAKKVTGQKNMIFQRDQIHLGNEVFPEAAVADPLADLEILDEWRNGIRVFPYPGQYSRLEVFEQEGKGPSTSSIGVIGEIMAGIFAQVGISPWIIVRVIGQWPDFIFYVPQEKRYSFVEAKAFVTFPKKSSNDLCTLLDRVSEVLLSECAFKAVQQINTDPWVTVWGAFTYISTIKPFRLLVTFVEFKGADRQSNSDNQRSVPDAVVTGIATQAVVLGCQELQEKEDSRILLAENLKKSRKAEDKGSGGVDLERRIVDAAYRNLKELLAKAIPEELMENTIKNMDKEIKRITSDILKQQKKSQNQRPFYEGRRTTAKGKTATIRPIGNQMIYMCNLSAEEIDALDRNWKPDWNRASQAHLENNNLSKWRFGGALYWLQELIMGSTK